MIKNYSIIKLSKPKYDKEHITEVEPTPRLLVIKAYQDSQQYLVRYPDGFVHRVNADWVTTKSTFEPDHPEYTRVAKEMRAVKQEFRKNEKYQIYLNIVQPAFATDLTQSIEAQQRAYQERRAIQNPAPTTPVHMPVLNVAEATTNTDPTIMLLTSIDKSLKTLIQLWGGQQQ